MSLLQDELDAIVEREVGGLHIGFRPIAREGLLRDRRQQDEAATAARRSLADLSEVPLDRARADLEIAVAKLEGLRSKQERAHADVVEASNRLSDIRSAFDRTKRIAIAKLVPSYQIAAARAVLDRLQHKLDAWRAEPPPLLFRPFKLQPIPDPRFPTVIEQRAVIAEASHEVTQALHQLVLVERGTAEPPAEGLEAWLEAIATRVARCLTLELRNEAGDQDEKEELERIKWILAQLALGNTPIPT